jgi:hypothetical protein
MREAARAVKMLVKQMIELHVPKNLIGIVTDTQPITVDIAGLDNSLSEDEGLLISHTVRHYDEQHGLEEGDSLLLVPAHGGDYVATSVVTQNSSLSGVAGEDSVIVGGAVTGTLDATSAHVVVGGTSYPVIGGTVTVPFTSTADYRDGNGDVIGQVPLF